MILVSEAVGAHSHLILRKGRRRTEDLEKVSVTGRKSRGRATSVLGFRERRELRRVRVCKHKLKFCVSGVVT